MNPITQEHVRYSDSSGTALQAHSPTHTLTAPFPPIFLRQVNPITQERVRYNDNWDSGYCPTGSYAGASYLVFPVYVDAPCELRLRRGGGGGGEGAWPQWPHPSLVADSVTR